VTGASRAAPDQCLSATDLDKPLETAENCRIRRGTGRWRKLKGIATVRLPNGALRKVELHWYEAHGIGRKDLKIKRYLEEA